MRPIYLARTALQHTNDPRAVHNLDRATKKSLKNWMDLLASPPISSNLDIPTNTSPLRVYSDASNSALGILVRAGEQTFAEGWPLVEGWREKFQADIGPAEAWACEPALEAAIAFGARDQHLVLNCDNQGVVEAWKKGWSRSPLTNQAFYRMIKKEEEFGLRIEMVYVASEENPADAVSRGELPEGALPFPTPIPTPYGTVGGPNPTKPREEM